MPRLANVVAQAACVRNKIISGSSLIRPQFWFLANVCAQSRQIVRGEILGNLTSLRVNVHRGMTAKRGPVGSNQDFGCRRSRSCSEPLLLG